MKREEARRTAPRTPLTAAAVRLRRLLRTVFAVDRFEPRTIGEIQLLTGVSRRTVFRDLRILQEGGILVARPSDDSPYALAHGLAALGLPLSTDERLALVSVIEMMRTAPSRFSTVSAARSCADKLSLLMRTAGYGGEVGRRRTTFADWPPDHEAARIAKVS